MVPLSYHPLQTQQLQISHKNQLYVDMNIGRKKYLIPRNETNQLLTRLKTTTRKKREPIRVGRKKLNIYLACADQRFYQRIFVSHWLIPFISDNTKHFITIFVYKAFLSCLFLLAL